MNNLKLYGSYYKVFKGRHGIPDKITVIDIDGDTITFIRGHYTLEELTERADTIDEAINSLCLPKNKCSANKILTKISPKQKAILDKEDKEIQKMIYEAGRALEEFKNGYR